MVDLITLQLPRNVCTARWNAGVCDGLATVYCTLYVQQNIKNLKSNSKFDHQKQLQAHIYTYYVAEENATVLIQVTSNFADKLSSGKYENDDRQSA